MITFEAVSKRYPDGTVAVDDLSFEVAEGEVVVLVGPSGCGKTTTMRMVNRMVEPSSGSVLVAGRDVRETPAPELRRSIGYVIQQTGLFPHQTTAENIATVPRLLGWDEERTARRVAELMETVGLPQSVADRYPSQLSGGQRQRVGVARALAADPPILLMDEPFGAVDPLLRGRLQEEFLRIQAEVRKTILFVTHDIDEAIRMGDRLAILAQGGALQQYDDPATVLASPANDFVTSFLGAERGLKRLSLVPAAQVKVDPGPVVRPGTSRREAEQVAADHGLDWVVVVGDEGRLHGWARVSEMSTSVDDARLRPFDVRIRATDSLRTALDAMVGSRTGVAVRVTALNGWDRYDGILTRELLTEELL